LVLEISLTVATLFVALFGGMLALWAWMIRRDAPRDEAVPRTLRSMSHVGRSAFGGIAIVVLFYGLFWDSTEAIAGGGALILAAAGQHWVYQNWRE
jgi:hypothetical protein